MADGCITPEQHQLIDSQVAALVAEQERGGHRSSLLRFVRCSSQLGVGAGCWCASASERVVGVKRVAAGRVRFGSVGEVPLWRVNPEAAPGCVFRDPISFGSGAVVLGSAAG